MSNKDLKDAIENASDEAEVESATGGQALPEGMRETLSHRARNHVDAVRERRSRVDPKAFDHPTPTGPSKKSEP